MSIKEYLITVILLLALAVGGYHYLASFLLASTETTTKHLSESRRSY